MKKIYKYKAQTDLSLASAFTLKLPQGAIVLSVALQYGVPHVWVLVDVDEPDQVDRTFRWLGTGHPADDVTAGHFVGTVMFHDGDLVFHLFEITGATTSIAPNTFETVSADDTDFLAREKAHFFTTLMHGWSHVIGEFENRWCGHSRDVNFGVHSPECVALGDVYVAHRDALVALKRSQTP